MSGIIIIQPTIWGISTQFSALFICQIVTLGFAIILPSRQMSGTCWLFQDSWFFVFPSLSRASACPWFLHDLLSSCIFLAFETTIGRFGFTSNRIVRVISLARSAFIAGLSRSARILLCPWTHHISCWKPFALPPSVMQGLSKFLKHLYAIKQDIFLQIWRCYWLLSPVSTKLFFTQDIGSCRHTSFVNCKSNASYNASCKVMKYDGGFNSIQHCITVAWPTVGPAWKFP